MIERIRASTRSNDFLSRIGGDEFVLVTRCTALGEAERTAERIVAACGLPFAIEGGQEIACGVSIGVAYEAAGVDSGTWLAEADSAMSRPKKPGAVSTRLHELLRHHHSTHRLARSTRISSLKRG